MEAAGAILIDTDDLSLIDELGSALETVLIYEFKAGLAGYLSRLGSKAPIKSLKEIIDFNDRNKQLEMAYFGQNLLLAAEDAGPLTDYKYVEALAKCRRLSHRRNRRGNGSGAGPQRGVYRSDCWSSLHD